MPRRGFNPSKRSISNPINAIKASKSRRSNSSGELQNIRSPSGSPKSKKKNEKKVEKRGKAVREGEHFESARDKVIRRFRPGDKALKELRQYNKTPCLLIRKLPFQKVVREITNLNVENFRWTSNALMLLQTVTEDHMISFFEDAYACAMHAKRATLMTKDMALAARIRGQKNVVGIFVPEKRK